MRTDGDSPIGEASQKRGWRTRLWARRRARGKPVERSPSPVKIAATVAAFPLILAINIWADATRESAGVIIVPKAIAGVHRCRSILHDVAATPFDVAMRNKMITADALVIVSLTCLAVGVAIWACAKLGTHAVEDAACSHR